jgi:hypothetical protein
MEAFDNSLGRGRRVGSQRWIDSIPTLAMLGECYYQLGNLPMALASIDAALELVVQNHGWLSRVDFATPVGAVYQPARDSAWAGTAAIQIAPVAKKMTIQRGQVITEQRLAQGGAIESLNMVSVDIAEVLRTIAVALHRRRTIVGELSKDSGAIEAVLDATKYPADLNNSVGRTLISAVRTAGRHADLDNERVLAEAGQASHLGGAIHPLTPLVLLCQAEVLSESPRPMDAVPVAVAAAQAAAALGQVEWVGEPLLLAVGCADPGALVNLRGMATSGAGNYARDAKIASLALLLVASESAVLSGDPAAADALIGQAKLLVSKRGFVHPRLAAHAAYVSSVIATTSGQPLEGPNASITSEALSVIQNFTFNSRRANKVVASNPSLYQLMTLLENSARQGLDQRAEKRLRQFCDQPPAALWRRDPVEAIGWLMESRMDARARLLAASVQSEDSKMLLVETDAIMRHAFTSRLLLGGRLQNVRTLAVADPNRLSKEVNDFLKVAPRGLTTLRQSVTNFQQAAPTPDTIQLLEGQAGQAALARSPYPFVILPSFTPEMLKGLAPHQGILSFVFVDQRILGTLATANSVVTWDAGHVQQTGTATLKLMKEIGLGGNRAYKFGETSWISQATELRRKLLANPAFDSPTLTELIIVPTGSLWYLPFEMLPAGGEQAPFLGDKIAIRYAPTIGLALNSALMAPPPLQPEANDPVAETALATGLFFAPREVAVNDTYIQEVIDASGAHVRVPMKDGAPSGWYPKNIDRLVVAAPRNIDPAAVLQFAPIEEESGTYPGTLAGWLALPPHIPKSVYLPGARTAIAAGRVGDGSELFLSLTAMHAAGVRDVFMSRWPIGGQSTSIVLRELLQEQPQSGLIPSWQRARLLLQESELGPTTEPLVGAANKDLVGLTGKEPLFWASYIVSSSGVATKP